MVKVCYWQLRDQNVSHEAVCNYVYTYNDVKHRCDIDSMYSQNAHNFESQIGMQGFFFVCFIKR